MWGVVADGGGGGTSYNDHMTTITAEAVSEGRTSRIWKSVATFLAGAVLAGGLATGVALAREDSPSPRVTSPANTVKSPSVSSLGDFGCRLQVHGPC